MRLRRFVALLAFPVATALGASCAPVGIVSDFAGGVGAASGGGGYSGTTTGTTEATGGGVTFTPDGGTDGAIAPAQSYLSLCGGGHAACTPGVGVDQCAQGGNPGMGGSPPDASKLSCQIVPLDGGGVAAQCGTPAGGAEGDPCTAASDCGPEMGCVAGLTPTCRSYCCTSFEACSVDTYCVKAAMADAKENQIPVCIPAMKCQLLDDTTCPAGLTCAIVRQDGTTSCVVPGTGTDGQACPCAAGFTCSLIDNTCLELCHTKDTGECGPNALCQGGTKPYPSDIGYCVHE